MAPDSERNRSTEENEYDRKHQDRFDPNADKTGAEGGGGSTGQPTNPQTGEGSGSGSSSGSGSGSSSNT